MVGFSETDWIALFGATAILLAALMTNPRVLRVDLARRSSMIDSLARVHPGFRSIYMKKEKIPLTIPVAFLGALGALTVAVLLVGIYATASTLPLALYLFFLVPDIVTARIDRRIRAGLEPALADPSKAAEVVGEAHRNAPNALARTLLLLAIAYAYLGLLLAIKWSVFVETPFVVYLVLFGVFGPLYVVQRIGMLVRVQDILYRADAAGAAVKVPVRAYIAESGQDVPETVAGTLEGVGTTLQIRADDGFLHDIEWSSVCRIAAKQDVLPVGLPAAPST